MAGGIVCAAPWGCGRGFRLLEFRTRLTLFFSQLQGGAVAEVPFPLGLGCKTSLGGGWGFRLVVVRARVVVGLWLVSRWCCFVDPSPFLGIWIRKYTRMG